MASRGIRQVPRVIIVHGAVTALAMVVPVARARAVALATASLLATPTRILFHPDVIPLGPDPTRIGLRQEGADAYLGLDRSRGRP